MKNERKNESKGGVFAKSANKEPKPKRAKKQKRKKEQKKKIPPFFFLPL